MRDFMKCLISAIMFHAVCSCGNSFETNTVKDQDNTNKAAGNNHTQPLKTNCIQGIETFTQRLSWPIEVFDPAEDIAGFIQEAANISYAPDEFSLLVYMQRKDSSHILLFVKVLDSINKVKVIGTKKISARIKNISFATLCSSKCEFDYRPLGMYEVNTNGKVHTIGAWAIDKKKKVVYTLNPETVDCQDAYETDDDD